jgi:Vacuolar sorting 38 and autophagy-related subunit 14
LYQKRLVQDLQQIYPISCKSNDRYWIANAELPLDLFRGQVHEDEISAALGFLAQSLVLLSKYLNVALRHRIVCNSSRSAVQDADGTILPLFLSRVAERHQLERGLMLMHRNVDCLAQSQGLVSEESHILAKLDLVYDKVKGEYRY